MLLNETIVLKSVIEVRKLHSFFLFYIARLPFDVVCKSDVKLLEALREFLIAKSNNLTFIP